MNVEIEIFDCFFVQSSNLYPKFFLTHKNNSGTDMGRWYLYANSYPFIFLQFFIPVTYKDDSGTTPFPTLNKRVRIPIDCGSNFEFEALGVKIGTYLERASMFRNVVYERSKGPKQTLLLICKSNGIGNLALFWLWNDHASFSFVTFVAFEISS